MSGKSTESIIVLGGTGALGGVVVPVLADAGYHVVVYTRHPVAGERYEHPNVSVLEGNLENSGCNRALLSLATTEGRSLRGAVFINGAFQWDEGIGSPNFTQHLDELLEANVLPITRTLEELGPYWEKHGGGRVIMTSATAAQKPFPKGGAYAIAKGIVADIGRQIELEYPPEKIDVHVLAPRVIGNRMGENVPAELAREILEFIQDHEH